METGPRSARNRETCATEAAPVFVRKSSRKESLVASVGGSAPDYSLCESRLSSARLGSYLASAGGDRNRAIDLYEWNVEASGALYEAMTFLEVVLRNSIHDQLTAWHASQGLPGTWLDDSNKLLEEKARGDIGTAFRRAQQWRRVRGVQVANRPAPPIGAVVAELNFGFWRFLLASRYEHTLWLGAMRHGFPGAQGDRVRVEKPVRRLHEARNRIAHLEPILKRDLARDERDINYVIQSICPKTALWAAGQRRLLAVSAKRP
jgi:hypothetical protein